MTTLDKMLRAILLNPNDDVVRLAYADLLEEEGQDERAEFIRVQCELARIDEAWRDAGESQAPDGFVKVDRLRCRERKLLEAHRLSWAWPLPDLFGVMEFDGRTSDLPWKFRRGFVEQVTLTTEDFVGGSCDGDGTGRDHRHARDLFRAAPLTKVVLSDREPWFSGVSEPRYWKRQDSDDEQTCRWALPSCLYDLLHGKELASPRYAHGGSWKRFENEMAALSALRAAALLWGRRRAWPCPPCEGKGKQKCSWCGETERCTSWDCPLPKENHCPDCHGTGHTVTA